MLVHKQTPRLICGVGSGILSFQNLFVHKQLLPDFVSYFSVSVLASMHACAIWFELSILGLGSVNADGS